jgi:hypothetical protein
MTKDLKTRSPENRKKVSSSDKIRQAAQTERNSFLHSVQMTIYLSPKKFIP